MEQALEQAPALQEQLIYLQTAAALLVLPVLLEWRRHLNLHTGCYRLGVVAQAAETASPPVKIAPKHICLPGHKEHLHNLHLGLCFRLQGSFPCQSAPSSL